MRYVIYARRSQDRDERQVQSLPDQLAKARELAAARNLDVVAEFAESASAKEPYKSDNRTPARDDFARMISIIRKRQVDAIISWHPDRLSRNEIDAATIVWLIRHGFLKDLAYCNYVFINSPEGIMMLQSAMSQGQYFSSKLSTDVKRGMDSKAASGWMTSCAPQGYLNITDEKNFQEFRYIGRDPKRWDIIRRFWDLMLAGEHSVPQALDILNNEWGFRTRIGKTRTKTGKPRGGVPLSEAGAYGLLNNIFYTGQFRTNGTIIQGQHEAMVTVSEFNRVQQFLHRHQKPRLRKHFYAYTGLIQCARCGSQVTASEHKLHRPNGKPPFRYYYCSNKHGNCRRLCIPEAELENQIGWQLDRISIAADVADYTRTVLDRWEKQQPNTLENVAEDQKTALDEAQRQQKRLVSLVVREVISEQAFHFQNLEMERQILTLQGAVDDTKQEFERVQRSARNAVDFAKGARSRFLVGTPEERREIARALGVTYTFDGQRLSVTIHPALTVFLDRRDSKSDQFKPPDTPDLNTKKALAGFSFQFGGPHENLSQILYEHFRQHEEFPQVECLAAGSA